MGWVVRLWVVSCALVRNTVVGMCDKSASNEKGQ